MAKMPLLALLLALAGCVNLPELNTAQPELPAAWPEGQTQQAIAPDWWTVYGDPVLEGLVTEALAHNRDLRLAAARIAEAQANLGLARAERYPSAQLRAGASRSRSSEETSFTPPTNPSNSLLVNLQAAYEADLWGRYRAATEAARAELLATRYAAEVVRLSLAAGVVQGYFSLRALDGQLQVARETLDNRQAAQGLQRLRVAAGVEGELALRQAEAEVAASRADLATLSGQRRQQELALGVLLGREPRGLVEDSLARGAELAGLALPPAIPSGLPAALLARRPDLRQAEQILAAAHARIGVARAALYPSLSLTANLGSESAQLGDLFSGPATLWGIGASLAQTVFNAGRTEAATAAADARQLQALAQYEQAIRQAFREVLDALVAHRQARELAEAQGERAGALARAAELAELRYRNGISSYLEVLDAQRHLYQARQGQIDAHRAQLVASAALVKALGGGWSEAEVAGRAAGQPSAP